MPQQQGLPAGFVAVAVAMAWYAQAQVRWFIQDLGIDAIKATSIFLRAVLLATVAALSVAIIISFDANIAPATG